VCNSDWGQKREKNVEGEQGEQVVYFRIVSFKATNKTALTAL